MKNKYENFFKKDATNIKNLELLQNNEILCKMTDEEIETLINSFTFEDEVEEKDIIEFKETMKEYIISTKDADQKIESMNNEWKGLSEEINKPDSLNDMVINHEKMNKLYDDSIETAKNTGNLKLVKSYIYDKKNLEFSYTLQNMKDNLDHIKSKKINIDFDKKNFDKVFKKFINKMKDLPISFAFNPVFLIADSVKQEFEDIEIFVYDLCKYYNSKGKNEIYEDSVFLNNLIINIYKKNSEKHEDVKTSFKEYMKKRSTI